MQIILYLSIAVIAIAFFILVIYLSKTLKSLQATLDSVSKTLIGLEGQLDGVTRETTALLQKTNALAEDIQHKSAGLNNIVDAVVEVGDSVRSFNGSIQRITGSINNQLKENEDRISQVVQWSQVLMELREKWKMRKQAQTSDVEADKPKPQKRWIRERNY